MAKQTHRTIHADKPLNNEAKTQSLTLDESGNVVTQPAIPKGCIYSIAQWNKAWRVFMTTIIQNPSPSDSQKSSLAVQRIAYMNFINMLHSSGTDFIHYDSNFLQYRQYHGTSFVRVDHCLHMEAQAKGRPPNFRPSKFSPSPNHRQPSKPSSSDLATAKL